MKKPPNKLHKLLALALKDYDQISVTPGYEIAMTAWVVENGGVCRVCLAGCVMVRRLGIKHSALPSLVPEWEDALQALDFLRDGCVMSAVEVVDRDDDIPARVANTVPDITNFDENRKTWRKDMTKLHDWLKEHDA